MAVVPHMKPQRDPSHAGAAERPGPGTVAALAFVTAVLTGFGVIVIGNDLGPVLAEVGADRSEVWRPLLVFLCAPVAAIVAASALAAVTGSRHPASALAAAAVVFGTLIGAGSGRLIWRFLEVQTYGEVQGLLDTGAIVVLASSVLLGGVGGALIGDRIRPSIHAERISHASSIVATALLTYPSMELIAGRVEVGTRQLWMLAFMLFALAIAPRIGLMMAEGNEVDLLTARANRYDLNAERDQSAAVRLLIGFSAGWMVSILVNMNGLTFDGQLARYVLAWTLPVLLMSPGILAHLDRIGSKDIPTPAVIETFKR